jgi:hypothetical protein
MTSAATHNGVQAFLLIAFPLSIYPKGLLNHKVDDYTNYNYTNTYSHQSSTFPISSPAFVSVAF